MYKRSFKKYLQKQNVYKWFNSLSRTKAPSYRLASIISIIWVGLRMRNDFYEECFYFSNMYLQTYIHNWPLQSFSQDYGLAFFTTYVVYVNFIHEWRDLQFNVGSERQILFMPDLFTLRVFARNLLRGILRRNIFFIFSSYAWPGIRTRALRLIANTLPTGLRRLL